MLPSNHETSSCTFQSYISLVHKIIVLVRHSVASWHYDFMYEWMYDSMFYGWTVDAYTMIFGYCVMCNRPPKSYGLYSSPLLKMPASLCWSMLVKVNSHSLGAIFSYVKHAAKASTFCSTFFQRKQRLGVGVLEANLWIANSQLWIV